MHICLAFPSSFSSHDKRIKGVDSDTYVYMSMDIQMCVKNIKICEGESSSSSKRHIYRFCYGYCYCCAAIAVPCTSARVFSTHTVYLTMYVAPRTSTFRPLLLQFLYIVPVFTFFVWMASEISLPKHEALLILIRVPNCMKYENQFVIFLSFIL
jgi:hypothetical protein